MDKGAYYIKQPNVEGVTVADFLKSFIPTLRLSRGVDFRVYPGKLWVKDQNIKNNIRRSLESQFPAISFYSTDLRVMEW